MSKTEKYERIKDLDKNLRDPTEENSIQDKEYF